MGCSLTLTTREMQERWVSCLAFFRFSWLSGLLTILQHNLLVIYGLIHSPNASL